MDWRYQGGKNGAGVYQAIINAIPPHRVYVEAFAGSAAIYRRKAPAASSILMERDPAMADRLRRCLPAATVMEGDAIQLLASLDHDLHGYFIYLDPPYLHSTRKDASLYRFELDDGAHQHLVESLLPALSARGALWALSGYRSAMYDVAAARNVWDRKDFRAMTRRGVAIESLWTNYFPRDLVPAELTYIGDTFRERERIKRKAARWVGKLSKLPMLEREFIMARLASIAGAGAVGRHRQDGREDPA